MSYLAKTSSDHAVFSFDIFAPHMRRIPKNLNDQLCSLMDKEMRISMEPESDSKNTKLELITKELIELRKKFEQATGVKYIEPPPLLDIGDDIKETCNQLIQDFRKYNLNDIPANLTVNFIRLLNKHEYADAPIHSQQTRNNLLYELSKEYQDLLEKYEKASKMKK